MMWMPAFRKLVRFLKCDSYLFLLDHGRKTTYVFLSLFTIFFLSCMLCVIIFHLPPLLFSHFLSFLPFSL